MNNQITRRLGIVVARAIIAGDLDRARREAAGRRSWGVSEARAIVGACRVARERFAGCSVTFSEFLGESPAPEIAEPRRPARASAGHSSSLRLRDMRAHIEACRMPAGRCKACR